MLLTLTSCSRSARTHVITGDELSAAGKHDEAEIQYRKAIQKDPGLSEAHYKLGLVLLEQRDKPGAHQAFTSAVAISPDLEDAQVKLADLELEAYRGEPSHPQRPYEALKKISAALLANNPQSVEGLRLQGQLALMDRRPAEALAAFRAARTVQPWSPQVVHGMMQALGPSAEAEKLGLGLIEKDKSYGLIYDDLYALYMATGRPAEAERIFQTKVANNPDVAAYRLQLAAHFINSGKKTEMENALKPLREDAKRFPTGRLDAGEFYMRLSMWEEAQAMFEQTAQTDPARRMVAKKRLVQALMGRGQLKEAAAVAEQTAKGSPQDIEARLAVASMWLDTGDPEKVKAATQELEGIRNEKSIEKRPMYWYVLGRAWQRSGDDSKAMSAFQSALRLNPGFHAALISLGTVKLQRGESDLALEYANQALAADREDTEAKLLKARALLQARRFDDARSELTVLIRTNPLSQEAQLQLGTTLAAQQRYSEAEGIFKKVYKPGQADLRALEGLAAVYSATGREQDAIRLLTTDLQQSQNPNRVREVFGRVALLMKRPEIAVQQYEELTRTDPKNSRNYYLLAQALRVKGDTAGAISHLEKAAELNPNDTGILSVLGILFQTSGRNDEAAAKFRRVLELRPNDLGAMNNLAYALAESGKQLDEARQLAEKVVRSAPNQRPYSDTLGVIYLKTKMVDSALSIFANLVKQEPANPAYLYHLGLSQLEKGQKNEARATLSAALRNKPSLSVQTQIQSAMTRMEQP